jgi:hypothetical protein
VQSGDAVATIIPAGVGRLDVREIALTSIDSAKAPVFPTV